MTEEERRLYFAQYRKKNREKLNQWQRENYKKNKERYALKHKRYCQAHKQQEIERHHKYNQSHKEHIANHDYVRRFGITLVERNQMLEWQNSQCAICRKQENGSKLHVDHDHITNQIRMLLCGGCNHGGKITDNQELLRAKAEYIAAFSS